MKPMDEYYMAYENRYQKAYEAGIDHWGHEPGDEELASTLTRWVEENNLRGKRIIEFACGEGASGVILSRLGCIYTGIDIAPSAVKKSKEALKAYPQAAVIELDMVKQRLDEKYDAALDVMGFHMLVVDKDREAYLGNVLSCLKSGAPMIFFRQLYSHDAYEGNVDSFDSWKQISGSDYDTPQRRTAEVNGRDVEIYIPLIPGRTKTRNGYCQEFVKAGFCVDKFYIMDKSHHCPDSASIFVHKL